MNVINIIDSLVAAGAERVAVNIANGLAESGIESHLCATRAGGPLEEFINSRAKTIILGKKSMHDTRSLLKLVRYVRFNKIKIIHAHSSSIFWAIAVKCMAPGTKVVWHDHYGYSEHLDERPRLALKLVAPFIDHIFAVNAKLKDFALHKLNIPGHKVSFLPNFPDLNMETDSCQPPLDFPGGDNYPKIVCLANLRPQKDHHTLLDAFKKIKQHHQNAALYLTGGHYNDDYYHSVVNRVKVDNELAGSVHVLGSRNDVAAILKTCHVGVLSSASEGLPVSILEYGIAGLPVVSTNVGDCSLALDNGRCGILVKPGDSEQLANAILHLLSNPEEMNLLGILLKNHILKEFSKEGAMTKIITVYTRLLQ